MQTVTIDGMEYGPVTPLEDLPTQQVSVFADGEWQRYEQAILLPALTGRCLTRSEGEREEDGEWCHCSQADKCPLEKAGMSQQCTASDLRLALLESRQHVERLSTEAAERDTLTARVAELEEENGYLAVSNNSISENLTAAMKELATLREQCVLGEKLTKEEFLDLADFTPILHVDHYGNLCQGHKFRVAWTGQPRYLDPRLLPVLPEPEPEVPVQQTIWQVRVLEEPIGWVTSWFDNEEDAEAYVRTCDDSQKAVAKPFLIAALSGEGANE